MTKRRDYFVCAHCCAHHHRSPSQARYCSTRCAVLSRVHPDEVASEDGCWNWLGSLRPGGYGQITVGGRPRPAHRVMYEAENGPIGSSDIYCCHRCDNPRCVRPSHIFLGTVRENVADSVAKGRNGYGERHGGAKLTDEQVIAIRSSHTPDAELATKFGVTTTTITYVRGSRGWPHLPSAAQLGGRLPSRKFDSKLTAADVEFIRREYRSRDKERGRKAMMQRFGVSKTTITAVVQGHSYAT